MNKSIMNQREEIYNIKKRNNEIEENINLAIEYIEYGQVSKGIRILKAITKEIGDEG